MKLSLAKISSTATPLLNGCMWSFPSNTGGPYFLMSWSRPDHLRRFCSFLLHLRYSGMIVMQYTTPKVWIQTCASDISLSSSHSLTTPYISSFSVGRIFSLTSFKNLYSIYLRILTCYFLSAQKAWVFSKGINLLKFCRNSDNLGNVRSKSGNCISSN